MNRKKICITLILIEVVCIIAIFLFLNTAISLGMLPLLCLIILFITSIFGLIQSLVGFRRNALISMILLCISILGFFTTYHALIYQAPRPKGSIAILKAHLANTKAQAQLLFDTTSPHSYKSVCSDTTIVTMLDNASDYSKNDPKCFSDNDSFVITADFKKPMDENTYYCVDSTMTMKSVTSVQNDAIINSNTLCP